MFVLCEEGRGSEGDVETWFLLDLYSIFSYEW